LEYNGFRYFNDKEGYSLVTVLTDKQGKELYAACIPLQSLPQKDSSHLYTTGTKEGPGSLAFPQAPLPPLFNLQVAYRTDPKKERAGDAFFRVGQLPMAVARQGQKTPTEGTVAIGAKFDAGDYYLSAKEVRYWVGMNVRYDPGQPIVLWSLWVGLAGMVITTIGRIRRSRRSFAEKNLVF